MVTVAPTFRPNRLEPVLSSSKIHEIVESKEIASVRGRRVVEIGRLHPAEFGDPRRGDRNPRRLVRLPAEGMRRKIRAIGLDEQTIERDPRRGVAERIEVLIGERRLPRKRDMKAEIEQRAGFIPRPRERMKDPSDRLGTRFEPINNVFHTIAAMDNDGEIELTSELEMTVERGFLIGEGSLFPVSIEPGLADRDGFRSSFACEFDNAIPIAGLGLGDMIGVNPDRRKYHHVIMRKFEGAHARFVRNTDGDDRDDPRLTCSFENVGEFVGESTVVEMRVGIDQAPGNRRGIRVERVRRGQNGAPKQNDKSDAKGFRFSFSANKVDE